MVETTIGEWEIALRLMVAAVGGAVVGWEREAKNRPAGLRTHVLVAVGACAFTVAAFDVYGSALRRSPDATIDPLRVVGGIVGGVGFLGAGAILQSRGRVRGLTTAAGVWVVAALGVAAGTGRYALTGMTVAVAIATLIGLAKLERAVLGEDEESAERSDVDR